MSVSPSPAESNEQLVSAGGRRKQGYHQAIFQNGPLALKERTSLINTGLVFTVISGLEDVADGI